MGAVVVIITLAVIGVLVASIAYAFVRPEENAAKSREQFLKMNDPHYYRDSGRSRRKKRGR